MRGRRGPHPRVRRAMPLRWDEKNLAENEEAAEAAQRTKILEPKTPFHTLEGDGETPAAFPPMAEAAKAGGPLRPEAASGAALSPGTDLAALTSAALDRRAAHDEEDDEIG